MKNKRVLLVASADDELVWNPSANAIHPTSLPLPKSLILRIIRWQKDFINLTKPNDDRNNTAVKVYDVLGYSLAREIKEYYPERFVEYVDITGTAQQIE